MTPTSEGTGTGKADKQPVLVVTNKARRLIHVGDPNSFDKKVLAEYVRRGYQLKTITIKQYRARTWKWHWEK